MADNNKKETAENQNQQKDNAGLQHKLSNKGNPADVDKGSLSSKTSHGSDGGDQRSNYTTSGGEARPSAGDIGTDRQREKNRILNEQVKKPDQEKNTKK
ncbi:hypothetical protein [Nafulsella turpanensis]|uniref:hypothetical protein n=1 Tax=Nafulsella turpanensis TaxID=1265690 RepID=UPI00036719F2|nr:hypothetical protein [Nafulsella turpanensis]